MKQRMPNQLSRLEAAPTFNNTCSFKTTRERDIGSPEILLSTEGGYYPDNLVKLGHGYSQISTDICFFCNF